MIKFDSPWYNSKTLFSFYAQGFWSSFLNMKEEVVWKTQTQLVLHLNVPTYVEPMVNK